jgi:predicted secreted hydrolase
MKTGLQHFCVLLLLPVLLPAQQEIQYRLALPGYIYSFPKDHGAHPEFKLEWWYYTGSVRSSDGREFGYELTFFRSGVDHTYENPSMWRVRDLYMAHFAITDIANNRFYYFEKLNRAGPGIAGAAVDSLHAWNENWSAVVDNEQMKISARADQIAIDLRLSAKKPPVVHGVNGVSQKAEGPGHASHYYSMTRLATTGTIRIGSNTAEVTGESWMDHEFGTNQLTQSQAGWDWFSIQLENGSELMLYRMRNRDGTIDLYSSGTIVGPDSKVTHLGRADFVATPGRQWKSDKSGSVYPIEWTVTITGQDIQLQVVPFMDNQELVTTRSTGIAYWEGAMKVSGTWRGKPVQGRGYLELTGYSEQNRPRV